MKNSLQFKGRVKVSDKPSPATRLSSTKYVEASAVIWSLPTPEKRAAPWSMLIISCNSLPCSNHTTCRTQTAKCGKKSLNTCVTCILGRPCWHVDVLSAHSRVSISMKRRHGCLSFWYNPSSTARIRMVQSMGVLAHTQNICFSRWIKALRMFRITHWLVNQSGTRTLPLTVYFFNAREGLVFLPDMPWLDL